ncbi:MAG: LuxR C-terminal-related transcriptional regulator, partial [Burkholderiaceae bacterium]
RLHEARRLRCVVLTGPAGAGKSTTLAAWRRALLPLGFEVAWLSLAAEDDDLARFLDALVASVAQIDPSLASVASLLGGGATDADGVERLIVTLVRAIAGQRREIAVVLDDLHHLTQPRIGGALQWLLNYAPPNLHLVLASRTPVPLSLERLRAQGQVLELDRSQLRFSPAESEQFLKLQLEGIDARSARQLHDLTDGWVAGLQLLSIEWKKKQRRKDAPAPGAPSGLAEVRDARAFGRFFEREVFAQLAKGDIDLLVALAPCSRFCASLCATLIDRPEAIGEVAALLTRLEADNLFIVPIDSAEPDTCYRLHPLLRETLMARFSAADAAWQRAVQARAWHWFRERGWLEEAIRHALRAGEGAQAADLIERCAQGLFVRGERGTLISLIRQLPEDEVNKRLQLRMWVMRSHLFLRELDTCAASIEALARDIPQSDAQAHFLLAVNAGSLAVQRDDTDAAMKQLPRMQAPPPGADVVALGGSLNIQSWLHMHRGDYEQARQVQRDGAPVLADGVPLVCTAAGSLYGRCLVGLSHALEGQITQAERIYRAVLHEAGQLGKACADTTVFVSALLGDVLYESDDAEEARRLLEDRVDILERISIPDAVLRALRVLSASHWLAGNHLEAFAYLERLEDYALKHGLDRLLAHSLAHQAGRRLQLGQYLAAEACIARLDALDAKHPNAEHSALREISDLAQRVRIRWRVTQGDLDGAAAQLTALRKRSEARGRQRGIARLTLEGALIEARRRNPQAAREMTLQALRLGHRLGLVRSLIDTDDAALGLIRELARSETLDPVLAFYVERLEASARKRSAQQQARDNAANARTQPENLLESFSGREIDMLRLISQAMPNKKIARTLGLSPETVKWYLSRIYAKLRVSGRDEAVARVRDLGWGLETGVNGPAAGSPGSPGVEPNPR